MSEYRYHTCDRCNKASLEYSRVKDAKVIDGYMFDFILCSKCKRDTQHVLDNGTNAFCDFIEEEKKGIDRKNNITFTNLDSRSIKDVMKNVGFTSYEWQGQRLDPCDPLNDSLIYAINTQKMIYPKWDPNRVVKEPTRIEKIKRYLSHVWYAIKGGECE